MKTNRLLIVRNAGKLYACSGLCTHQFSPLNVKGKALVCPKHGSAFDLDGKPTKGQARSELVRYAITKADDDTLKVDTAKSFKADAWSEAESFVEIKA